MTTKRKPYVRGMKASWWQELGFYKFYMLREGTAVPTVWFSLVLIYGVLCLGRGLEGMAAFIGFLQNPIVLFLNVVTLAATLLHTKTWFDLAPKAANLVVNNEKVPAATLIKALWAVMVVVTLIILAFALL